MNEVILKIEQLTRDIERIGLDLLAATVTWLPPLIPAFLAAHNMIAVLQFPTWLALVGGVVVESLGLVSIHTTFQFWNWNENRREGGPAPTLLAASTGAFYLSVVLTVNVILDIGISPAVQIVAKALLSLISVPAGVVLALRAQHSRRTHDQQQKEIERREARRLARQERAKIASGTPLAQPPARGTYAAFKTAQMARNGKGPMSAGEIVTEFNVPKRTAYNWLTKFESEVAQWTPTG